jgi:hypothetical protein
MWIYKRHGRSQKQYHRLQPHHTNSFPRGCLPISGEFQSGKFIISGYVHWSAPIVPILTTQSDISNTTMNRGIRSNIPLATVAQSIWDGHAMVGTDGSVKDDTATNSWIISSSLITWMCVVVAFSHRQCTTWNSIQNHLKRPHSTLASRGSTIY